MPILLGCVRLIRNTTTVFSACHIHQHLSTSALHPVYIYEIRCARMQGQTRVLRNTWSTRWKLSWKPGGMLDVVSPLYPKLPDAPFLSPFCFFFLGPLAKGYKHASHLVNVNPNKGVLEEAKTWCHPCVIISCSHTSGTNVWHTSSTHLNARGCRRFYLS